MAARRFKRCLGALLHAFRGNSLEGSANNGHRGEKSLVDSLMLELEPKRLSNMSGQDLKMSKGLCL